MQWIKNKDKKSAAQKLLDEHPDNHGIERMQLALERKGIKWSYSTVKRAMRLGNLIHESNRSPDGLTKADKKAQRPENIIDRDFTAELPDQKWLTDITEVHCLGTKLYIAPVMDCCGGEIVACAMDTARMTVEEVKKEVWRYIFAYYNTIRISAVNGGLPPAKYRLSKTALLNAA